MTTLGVYIRIGGVDILHPVITANRCFELRTSTRMSFALSASHARRSSTLERMLRGVDRFEWYALAQPFDLSRSVQRESRFDYKGLKVDCTEAVIQACSTDRAVEALVVVDDESGDHN